MEKNYCVVCGKYSKFAKSKISYILQKKLILYVISSKCGSSNGEKIFKEQESIETLNILK